MLYIGQSTKHRFLLHINWVNPYACMGICLAFKCNIVYYNVHNILHAGLVGSGESEQKHQLTLISYAKKLISYAMPAMVLWATSF